MELPTNNTEWITRAFLQVKAALSAEIATCSGEFISEDYIRSALLRGLMLSNPNEASRVQAEMSAHWSPNPSWDGNAAAADKRPRQHDIGVSPGGNDNGLVCEVKWLKQAQTGKVMQDVWKVALTRGLCDETTCVRTYLLVGGDHEPFSETLASLQSNKWNFRWSAAGAGTYETPPPRNLNLWLAIQRSETVRNAAVAVLRRGKSGLRTPPDCARCLRLSVRDVWHMKVGDRSWTAVLWELDHRGVPETSIDWESLKADLLASKAAQNAN